MGRMFGIASLYAIVASACLACVSSELTMRVFRNSAMAPPASANLTVNSLEMTVPFNAAHGEGTAEITGVHVNSSLCVCVCVSVSVCVCVSVSGWEDHVCF